MIKKNIKILLVDDHSVLLCGIEELILNNIRDVEILKAKDQITALTLINNISDLDLVICDLQLGETGKSFNLITQTQLNKQKTIVFTAYENKIYIEECIKLGILSYVCKRSGEFELLNSIIAGLNGESKHCPITINSFNQDFLLFRPFILILTKTEKALLKCWSSGMSNSDIVKKFNYNENTLRTHRRHILHKNKCNFEQLLANYSTFHDCEIVDLSILKSKNNE
jgi:DNA-binding NarL/FixJ family response regulator